MLMKIEELKEVTHTDINIQHIIPNVWTLLVHRDAVDHGKNDNEEECLKRELAELKNDQQPTRENRRQKTVHLTSYIHSSDVQHIYSKSATSGGNNRRERSDKVRESRSKRVRAEQ